jgi:hypothetical protein
MPLIDDITRHAPPSFDLDEVLARLLDKVYGLLSALPTFLLALLVVWVGGFRVVPRSSASRRATRS